MLGKCEVRDPKGEWVALLGWGLGVSEGGSHVGTSQQRSSFRAHKPRQAHRSCTRTLKRSPFGAYIEHSEA